MDFKGIQNRKSSIWIITMRNLLRSKDLLTNRFLSKKQVGFPFEIIKNDQILRFLRSYLHDLFMSHLLTSYYRWNQRWRRPRVRGASERGPGSPTPSTSSAASRSRTMSTSEVMSSRELVEACAIDKNSTHHPQYIGNVLDPPAPAPHNFIREKCHGFQGDFIWNFKDMFVDGKMS